MNLYQYLLLILIAALHFLLSYAYFNNKFESFLLWSLNERVKDLEEIEGYKKQQGKSNFILGVMILLITLSIYVADNIGAYKSSLYVWLFLMVGVYIGTSLKTRKYLE